MRVGSLPERLGIVGNCDDTTLAAAARTIASNALNVDDARTLLAMCGLLPSPPDTRRRDSVGRVMDRPPVTCINCGKQRDHHAHGLCGTCDRAARRRQARASEPPRPRATPRRADAVLNEWTHLRGEGLGLKEAAERLDMRPDSLRRALLRARRRGDPRAVWDGMQPLTERTDRAS